MLLNHTLQKLMHIQILTGTLARVLVSYLQIW